MPRSETHAWQPQDVLLRNWASSPPGKPQSSQGFDQHFPSTSQVGGAHEFGSKLSTNALPNTSSLPGSTYGDAMCSGF